MSNKTQPARGTRDFLPLDVRRRNYVIGVIKEVYESYGFEPLETPAIENLETLTGKYGEEGSQLMFKILKRGEKLDVSQGEKGLSDLALRYDLTVPLARVVANYKNELPKFFKRYQIQPVWRADRPARGRYREFYQCDVDAIGSSSIITEVELISAVGEILMRLGFADFEIRLNHRQILSAILNAAAIPPEQHSDALVALDKADKIGIKGVRAELVERGISDESIEKIFGLYNLLGGFASSDSRQKAIADEESKNAQAKNAIRFADVEDTFAKLSVLSTLKKIDEFIGGNDDGLRATNELLKIFSYLSKTDDDFNLAKRVKIDATLARGLSYYTGTIIEIVLTKGDFSGSITGGGRYDNLIGMFGKEQIPACGLSIGLERILVVMEERGMFPPELQTNAADVLVMIWNEETAGEALKLANELRANGLRVSVYPEADKLGKQFKYADTIGVRYVCVLGESELAENKVTLKNMQTGEQEKFERENIAARILSKRT